MNLIPWRNKRNEGGLATENLATLRNNVDRLFDRFFDDPWGMGLLEGFGEGSAWQPRVDLAETDSEITVRAELPGMDPEAVDIRVSGDVLTLKGEKSQEREEKEKNYHYVERQYGAFQRSIRLPASIDPNKVDAAFKNGLLTVTISKRPEARPTRVRVRQA